MLSARDLSHRYGTRTVVDVPSLDLEAGTITALAGPNGAGKSTLLRILACLEAPAGGRVALDGRPVDTVAARRRARRRVTLVEQRPQQFRGSVTRNLCYALSLHGVPRHEAAQRAAAALQRLDLTPLAHREARHLSEGEVQRVAVARALALQPSVLLLDEPVSGADAATTARVYGALETERARGAAVCFASHQVEDAYRWSDRLLAMADGKLSTATPVNLFRTVIPDGSGPRVIQAGPLEIHIHTERTGPATIAIPPDDVVISQAPLHSSARNAFEGRVTRIADDGRGGIMLTVDVGVDLKAHITRAALEDLRVSLGSTVVVTFKAMAVRVF